MSTHRALLAVFSAAAAAAAASAAPRRLRGLHAATHAATRGGDDAPNAVPLGAPRALRGDLAAAEAGAIAAAFARAIEDDTADATDAAAATATASNVPAPAIAVGVAAAETGEATAAMALAALDARAPAGPDEGFSAAETAAREEDAAPPVAGEASPPAETTPTAVTTAIASRVEDGIATAQEEGQAQEQEEQVGEDGRATTGEEEDAAAVAGRATGAEGAGEEVAVEPEAPAVAGAADAAGGAPAAGEGGLADAGAPAAAAAAADAEDATAAEGVAAGVLAPANANANANANTTAAEVEAEDTTTVQIPAACLELLVAAQNENGQLKKEEYFVFSDGMANGYYTLNNMTSYSDLPATNKFGYVTLTCWCRYNGGRGNCCQGDRAKIDVAGVEDPASMPTFMQQYILNICEVTARSIGDNVLGSPTGSPTAAPTGAPSTAPSVGPSAAPSAAPAGAPSATPTAAPSAGPSATPTPDPTAGPTIAPSPPPTVLPSALPSAAPSGTILVPDPILKSPEDSGLPPDTLTWIALGAAAALGLCLLCVLLCVGRRRSRGTADDDAPVPRGGASPGNELVVHKGDALAAAGSDMVTVATHNEMVSVASDGSGSADGDRATVVRMALAGTVEKGVVVRGAESTTAVAPWGAKTAGESTDMVAARGAGAGGTPSSLATRATRVSGARETRGVMTSVHGSSAGSSLAAMGAASTLATQMSPRVAARDWDGTVATRGGRDVAATSTAVVRGGDKQLWAID